MAGVHSVSVGRVDWLYCSLWGGRGLGAGQRVQWSLSLLPALFEKAEIVEEERQPSHLIVAISSDRGLCGGIHSNVAKNVKATFEERPSDSNTAIVCIGDKTRIILQRTQRKNIMLSFNEVGKQPPVFVEAAFVAQHILNSGLEYQSAEVVFSKFRSVLY